ncbi:MAG: amidoligase family protein [archaeon]
MKKFSIENINDFNILKNAVVGFEFEFFTEKSYFKLLEFLNREMGSIETRGYKKYHSKFNPNEKIFKIEPDYSLGSMGVELVTGPLTYVNSRIVLLKILKLIQEYGRTNEKCSIHINISFEQNEKRKTIELLNILKLILSINEKYIYKKFPERENNFYAKSVTKIIPFKGFDFTNNAIRHITNNLELPDTKYYGINTNVITDGRIEFRYIGGLDYQYKTAEILDLMDYFILETWNSIDEELNDEDISKLREYLNKNISNFKRFKNYENFISEFPTIKLQVDKNIDNKIIKTYYNLFYDQLFNLLNNIYNLQDSIINWNNESKRLELVDSNIKGIFDIKNVDIIDCVIDSGNYYKCNLINCEIRNAHIGSSSIINTGVLNSKIDSSKIDSTSDIKDCYLFNTLLDGFMKGGVFRSGKIGENAIIEDDVEIITNMGSYFGVKQKEIEERGKGKDKKVNKNQWIK